MATAMLGVVLLFFKSRSESNPSCKNTRDGGRQASAGKRKERKPAMASSRKSLREKCAVGGLLVGGWEEVVCT